jgi:nucleoside 2-deoxyribosyltransferase
MKAYIAGKLGTGSEKEFLESIAKICEKNKIKTFLPHRDVGICKGMKDVKRTFEGDITKGFKDCNLVIADLNGLHVGAGTAWELGYAYAKGIPAIGIKTDEPIEEALDYLSSIIIASTKIVTSLEEFEKELKKIANVFGVA